MVIIYCKFGKSSQSFRLLAQWLVHYMQWWKVTRTSPGWLPGYFFCCFLHQNPTVFFWLRASQANFLGSQTPITPTLPVRVALRLGPNSQLGPTMSLRFPTTGLSQLGNKNTAYLLSTFSTSSRLVGTYAPVGRYLVTL